ncbi:MAG TPA: hypothetical protein VFF70_13000, partial [Anaerolineae bacterium]|nr:hypothetical protein [Anaerolineae bacterium]
RDQIERELTDRSSLRYQVFDRYSQLLKARSNSPAFDPHGVQRVIECGHMIFAVVRNERVLCLYNVSNERQTISIDPNWRDAVSLIDGRSIVSNSTIDLAPYQILWLKRND